MVGWVWLCGKILAEDREEAEEGKEEVKGNMTTEGKEKAQVYVKQRLKARAKSAVEGRT